MKFCTEIPVYGDVSYRGKCPRESVEQVAFFNHLRAQYPQSYGLIALHPRNEGERHYTQTARQRAEGMAVGAADVIIPGAPSFVCEIKRRDHTLSVWQPGQVEFLTACKNAGAFVCVALGYDAAWAAFNDWRAHLPRK